MNAAVSPAGSNIVEILIHRAASHPHRAAYHFIGDDPGSSTALDYSTLLKEAASLATLLQAQELQGKPILLACKSNRSFIASFFACLMAGAVAVPTAPPRRALLEQRLRYIATQAQVAGVLSDSDAVLQHEAMRGLAAFDLREGSAAHWPDPRAWEPPAIGALTAACILYTSGTVAEPHGVMLDHGNLVSAALGAAESFSHPGESISLLTLPLFHDMGLLLGVIHPLVCDVPVYLTTPAQFVQKPQRWLKLLQKNRVTVAGGPNFMFDILIRDLRPEQIAGLDLSAMQVLFCTGEPIRSATAARLLDLLAPFGLRHEAFMPAYSMTETLGLVTGGLTGTTARTDLPGFQGMPHPLVGCGRAQRDREVIIVDPVSRTERKDGQQGEIWLRGGAIGKGYWRNPLLTEAIFHAHLADGRGPYVRTGDAGYLKDGELYFLGRLTDRIRLQACDHYPQDLEYQAERSHLGIRPSSSAAFTIDGKQRPRLIIACELKKDFLRRREKWTQIESAIRAAIRRVHGLQIDDLLLLMPGSLPKTSSGKIKRNQCRSDHLDGSMISTSCQLRGTRHQNPPSNPEI